MRIVIDLQACQSGSRMGGIGRYSLALAKSMVKEAADHDVFVVLSDAFPLHQYELQLEFSDILPPERFFSFASCGSVRACDPQNSGRKRIAELVREDFIRGLNPDILHVASLVEGWGDDVVTSIEPNAMAERTAVTWYDLIPYVQPDMYLRDPGIASHYFEKIDEVKKARCLLAISEYSATEAVDLLGLPERHVINISAGVDDRFHPVESTANDAHELKQKYGISKPFLLYTGSFDARKNQSGLIQAFGLLPSELRQQYQLVIAGNGWDGVYRQLQDTARRAGLDKQSVIFTGHVSDQDLLSLYRQAYLFVFPSLREGCGLPGLEAMACGTPAIGSNCTSVPEVIGRKDALFDPKSPASIAEKIHQVLTNKYFREVLMEHGLRHAKTFSWDRSARRAVEAFEEIHAENRSRVAGAVAGEATSKLAYESLVEQIAGIATDSHFDDPHLDAIACAVERNVLLRENRFTGSTHENTGRSGWITTWGTRCGIASYSKYLIDACPEKPVAVLAEAASTTEKEDGGPLVFPCWRAGHDDLTDLSKQIDALGLDTLVIQFNYGFFDFPALNRFVDTQVALGRRIVIMFHATTDPPPKYGKKLAELVPALSKCTKILVHTSQDAARLHELGVQSQVAIIPHGVPVVTRDDALCKAKPNKFVIGTYGFCLRHKGLIEMLHAFSTLATDPELHLMMVNAEYSPHASGEVIAEARDFIQQQGLQHRVTLCTDFLTDAESLAKLRMCDLLVFPYQETGESSSAAVRLGLASGVPVAVTPLPIFANVSETVVQLPGCSVDELTDGVRDLIQQIRSGSHPDLEALAKRAKAWRDHHSVSNIARQLGCILNGSRNAVVQVA